MTQYRIFCGGYWTTVDKLDYDRWCGRKRISKRKKANRCRRNALWFWNEDHTDYQAAINRG